MSNFLMDWFYSCQMIKSFIAKKKKMYIKEHDYLIYQTPTLYSLKYFFSLDNMIDKNY